MEDLNKRVTKLEAISKRHEIELYGGSDEDGDRKVSVLEQLETMGTTLEDIQDVLKKGVKFVILAIKRLGWFILVTVGFLITGIVRNWDFISNVVSFTEKVGRHAPWQELFGV